MTNSLKTLPFQLSVGLLGFSLLLSAPANAQSIKQEFEGNFSLVNSSPLLTRFLPDNTDYSGFILYDEEGQLQDFVINLDALNLNLTPESTLGGTDLIPTISFDFLSSSNWDLVIDFGIAFDAPLFSLNRDNSQLSFDGLVGLAGGYQYLDTSPTINVSSIPEPLTLTGVGTALAFGIFFKRSLSKNEKKKLS